MKLLIKPVVTPWLTFGPLALLSACGGGVPSIGDTSECGSDSTAYLAGKAMIPVRCAPQAQSPSNQRV